MIDGKTLRDKRKNFGLTQQQMGRILGTAISTLSLYETGINGIPWYVEMIVEMMDEDRDYIPIMSEGRHLKGYSEVPNYIRSILFLMQGDTQGSVDWLVKHARVADMYMDLEEV